MRQLQVVTVMNNMISRNRKKELMKLKAHAHEHIFWHREPFITYSVRTYSTVCVRTYSQYPYDIFFLRYVRGTSRKYCHT